MLSGVGLPAIAAVVTVVTMLIEYRMGRRESSAPSATAHAPAHYGNADVPDHEFEHFHPRPDVARDHGP